MTRQSAIRSGLVLLAILVLEALCQTRIIKPAILIAPSEMATALWQLLASGAVWPDLGKTLSNVLASFVAALAGGLAIGLVLHPRKRLRAAIEPYLASYYSVPFFAFYPLFIALFGVNDIPIILIGFMFSVVAVIVGTMNGLDQIPHVWTRVARVYRLGPVRTALFVQLPAMFLAMFAGLKLSIMYAFTAVIASEFILAPSGLGHAIAIAYNDFQNRKMFALMLLVIIMTVGVNALLRFAEERFLRRW